MDGWAFLYFAIMGIPKFFRWISERYPMCGEIIQEKRIPEFDNLYLDMNGIIHNCSHPNNEDHAFRITETQIFLNVFEYVAHIFDTIRPQKIFFLAVDGVAPRAKMNQQRARRFRAALDAEEVKKKAIAKGLEIPAEAAFDSNCITPGTPFMQKLQEQLQYFINKKISEDSSWQKVRVILSGHDVPGEGEHKITDYIRRSKSQPGYDPNTRHCMYGLDADLMMLALVTHEPHFALLREEVVFGRTRKTGITRVDQQTFYLFHISLFRDYLDQEFKSLREHLDFPYDLERIIDDYVLMCMFIGNDFLPHLPGLEINEGALSHLFKIYKEVLPGLGGYMNESGTLNMKKCQIFLEKLEEIEVNDFKDRMGDNSWLASKRGQESKRKSDNKKTQMSKILII